MKLDQAQLDALTQSIGSRAQAVDLSPADYAAVIKTIAGSNADVGQIAADVAAVRGSPRTLSFDLRGADDFHEGLAYNLEGLQDETNAAGKVRFEMTTSPQNAQGSYGLTIELRGAPADVKAVEQRIAAEARGVANFQTR